MSSLTTSWFLNSTISEEVSSGNASGIFYYYHDFWQDTSHPFTRRLPFLEGGPWKLFSLLFIYYMFVRHWGPQWMKHREPFDLKWVMFTHNVSLTLLNGVFFIWSLPYTRLGLSTWECKPYDHTSTEFTEHFLLFLGYGYYITKFLDMADTIFFVLRKKFRHISGLHVFHHSGMPLAGWIALKYSVYHCTGFVPFVNAFIHTIMWVTIHDNSIESIVLSLTFTFQQVHLLRTGCPWKTWHFMVEEVFDTDADDSVCLIFLPRSLFRDTSNM